MERASAITDHGQEWGAKRRVAFRRKSEGTEETE